MLFNSLAVSLDISERAVFTSHIYNVISVVRDPCFYIDLFKVRVEKAEECLLIVSKLTKNL